MVSLVLGQVYSSPGRAYYGDFGRLFRTGHAPINGTTQTIPIAGFAQLFIDPMDLDGNNKNIAAQFIKRGALSLRGTRKANAAAAAADPERKSRRFMAERVA
ncbi:MAG TPA: hypothetical protein VFI95_01330 [Terriglobales bacterium]|nr:hypothetical protein [Terriglobales bacterium]